MKEMLVSLCVLGLPLTGASIGSTIQDNKETVLSGKVRVTDGDSLRMGDKRIRLYGVDAVESTQTCDYRGEAWKCGRASKRALERLVDGQTVSCIVRDMDRGRYVSSCYVAGVDVNREQVRRGWAVAYTQYSSQYLSEEKSAHAAKIGLWRASFERPHDYRARLRREAEGRRQIQHPPSTDCTIKGNISRSGTKIYHMPGQLDYDRTSINEADGEHWFCTETAAVVAGWRKAKR